jgi:hypothetical protein
MRRTVLIAALVLASASAQAGQSRHLSVAGTDSHPISLPLPPAPAAKIAEVPPAPAATQPAPAVVAPTVAAPAPPAPPPAAAAPETGAPPAATPVAPVAPAAAAPATTETPKYVERPPVSPTTTETPKVDDGKPAKRAERRHRGGGYWTAGRIMGELRHYGISYGYGGW